MLKYYPTASFVALLTLLLLLLLPAQVTAQPTTGSLRAGADARPLCTLSGVPLAGSGRQYRRVDRRGRQQLPGPLADEEELFMAMRINDTAIVAVPGEAITEIGFQLQNDLLPMGWDEVFVFGLANGHMGYIVTPEEYDLGGYEVCASLYGRDTGVCLRNEVVTTGRLLTPPATAPVDGGPSDGGPGDGGPGDGAATGDAASDAVADGGDAAGVAGDSQAVEGGGDSISAADGGCGCGLLSGSGGAGGWLVLLALGILGLRLRTTHSFTIKRST